MGPLAATFWGRPSRRVPVVGVTGTSGKTTTTHLLASVLEHHGWPTAVIGTLSGPRTTPEAPELQALLAAEVAAGRQAVSLEARQSAGQGQGVSVRLDTGGRIYYHTKK